MTTNESALGFIDGQLVFYRQEEKLYDDEIKTLEYIRDRLTAAPVADGVDKHTTPLPTSTWICKHCCVEHMQALTPPAEYHLDTAEQGVMRSALRKSVKPAESPYTPDRINDDYTLERIPAEKPCARCKGEGVIQIGATEYDCSECEKPKHTDLCIGGDKGPYNCGAEKPCPHARVDHNGECLDCDEPVWVEKPAVDVEAIKCSLAKHLYGHNKKMWSLPYADHAVIDFLHAQGHLKSKETT